MDFESIVNENEKKDNGKVITSTVKVVGVKRISFTDKTGKLVEGVKIFFIHPIKKYDYNENDVMGYEIDSNNYSCFLKDINRYNEMTYKTLPYDAIISQEFIATNKPLKFIDIK
ncbi:MAG: hypothetical protein PHS24_04320 [Bacilli bacterium]|nr:hypothetical protein [Bacilli bacterium]